jgi:glycosyltransferase involved in cell wall biosynthesis
MMIALCLCVKGTDDEAPLLKQCLESVYEHVDGIFIQLNAPEGQKVSPRVRKVAEKYGANIEEYVWTGNFQKAKNDNFKQVPKEYEWIVWLDSDDTVENPEKIKEVAAVASREMQGIYIKYDYAHDKYGNVTVSHWNCRMVRNNGSFAWSSSFDDSEFSVHETLSSTRTVATAANHEFWVTHHADEERRDQSLFRNITLLEKMYDHQNVRGKVDPRVLFYLGTHYYDVGRYDEVIEMLSAYLKLSGWAQERSQAHVFIGKVLKSQGRTILARNAFLMALGEDPTNPDAFLNLGKLEADTGRYGQAINWLEKAKVKTDVHAMVQFHADYELYSLMAVCLLNEGGKRLGEALKWATKALKLRPTDPEAIAERDRIEDVVNYEKDMKAVQRLVKALNEEKDKIPLLLDSLPSSLADSPVVIGTRHAFLPKKVWPRKSMAIYCGNSVIGIWGPWSLKDGIGGSEEAVIQLSKELTALGWQVTVYCTPGDRAGTIDGVDWKQYWELNSQDEFDVLVAWRNPGFFNGDWKARKKYVWMHDVMDESEFDASLPNIDKVILLSDYHRSLFPNIPDNKILLSANGIIPEDFDIKPGERDPQRIIYMSSHVRGLEMIYSIWDEVKKAVPKAKLDIYYGWDSFVNILKDNPDRMRWRQSMIEWAKKLDGVTDHGKISHKQIIEEIYKSGVWAYPCPFPEIYCITAIKAQAGGAIPVSSNFAALEETVQYGVKIPMHATDEDAAVGSWHKKDVMLFKDALIDMLKNPDKQEAIRPEMMRWARTKSWKAVAEQWSKEMK